MLALDALEVLIFLVDFEAPQASVGPQGRLPALMGVCWYLALESNFAGPQGRGEWGAGSEPLFQTHPHPTPPLGTLMSAHFVGPVCVPVWGVHFRTCTLSLVSSKTHNLDTAGQLEFHKVPKKIPFASQLHPRTHCWVPGSNRANINQKQGAGPESPFSRPPPPPPYKGGLSAPRPPSAISPSPCPWKTRT